MILRKDNGALFMQNAGIRVGILFFLLLGFGMWSTSVSYAKEKEIQVALNEKEMVFQENPVAVNGTTFVQIRPLFEALGITLKWDGANRVVSGSKPGLTFSLPLGSKVATVNGKPVTLEAAALVRNNHTLVPLRLISEAAGVLVLWDPYNRMILMFDEENLKQRNVTRESVVAGFQVYLQQQKDKHANQKQPDPPVDKPKDNKTDPKLKTPASMKEIAHLKGMYYGYRLDVGGYQCGGVCWPKYTFLEGNKLFLNEPDNGGMETINCTKDACIGYTLKNGKLVLDNGKELTIQLNADGDPVIGGVRLTKVQPAETGLRLHGSYSFYGYGAAGTTWAETIKFDKNGTFTRSKSTGTYAIKGNTITFTYADGKVSSRLFFLHNGDIKALQIDNQNFNLDK